MNALVATAFRLLGVVNPDQDLVSAIAETSQARPFAGTPEETAAILTAVAYRESGGNKAAVGDGKTSFCAFQINLPGSSLTAEGWSGQDLLDDPKKCVAAAARIAARSWKVCGKLPKSDRLAAYARGRCESERGQRISRDRYQLAKSILKRAQKELADKPREVPLG